MAQGQAEEEEPEPKLASVDFRQNSWPRGNTEPQRQDFYKMLSRECLVLGRGKEVGGKGSPQTFPAPLSAWHPFSTVQPWASGRPSLSPSSTSV